MKFSSPTHTQNAQFPTIFSVLGRYFFHRGTQTTMRCYAGAIFLSCNPWKHPHRGRHRRNRAHLETQSLAAEPEGHGRARPDNEPTHRAHISDQAPLVWRAPEGLEGTGGLRDRPLRAAGSRVAISRAAGPDGARNTSGAASNKLNREFRLRRPWAATGPGRTTRRRTQAPPVWRAPEGPEGARGPGRGAGGWRQGQGGPRNRPLRAAGSRVAISRAGRRPPAHSAARPTGQEAQRAGRRPRAHRAARPSRHPATPKGAGTEVPAPLSAHSATASSRLRPNVPQSWRRRRIHRNMPPTTAAPRPAPPIRPSKPVRARPFFGLVAGTSGAT